MKKIMLPLFAIAVFLASCKKELDINANPNQPTAVTPNVVLSSALVGTGFNNARDFLGLTRWMGYWSRSGNYVPDVQTETYNMTNDYTDGEWSNLYTNLYNYDYIEKQGRTNGLPFYIGVAKAMKAYEFSILVDLYNNVPYTAAFDVNGKLKPAYDDGQAIYKDLIVQLDSALYYFDQAQDFYDNRATDVQINTDNQYDIVFGGSRPNGSSDYSNRLTLWKKYTNTLKLRLLINESQVMSAADISAELAKDTTGYLGAGESATENPGYQASTGKINPLYSLFYSLTTTTTSANYYRANSYAVNFYNTSGDVRQYGFYASQWSGATQPAVGSNYDGDPASVSNSSTTPVAGSSLTIDFSQDQFLMSDFESLFLQAEAAQRGYITADAQSLYESAVVQNYTYLYSKRNPTPYLTDNFGLSVSDLAAYYLEGDLNYNTPDDNPDLALVNWDAAEDKLALILTQKWASLNGIDWVAAYDDYRRTGFPTNDILSISKSNTHLQNAIPVRYLYPQSEYNTNATNIPALSGAYQFTSPVFWDK